MRQSPLAATPVLKTRLVRALLLWLGLGLLPWLGVSAGAQAPAAAPTLPATGTTPPATRAEAVFDLHFGTTVADPYRWLENLQAAETRRWFQDQNAYTRATLDALPGRAALRARIDTLAAGEIHVDNAQFGGNRVFYLKRDADANQYRLYVRDGLDGPERLLVDPTHFDVQGQPGNIDFYRPSPNGKRVAYGISLGGSEVAALHVLDVDSGRELGTVLPRMSIGDPVEWRIDSDALFYTQLNELPPDADPVLKFRNEQLWMREYAIDGHITDRRIFGRGFEPTLDVQPDDGVRIHLGLSSWAVVSAINGNANEAALYVAPLSSLHGPHPQWRKLLDAGAGVEAVALRGEWIYLLTSAGASHRSIVRWSLNDARPFALADAEVVLPAGERVITGINAARDALYVSESDAGYGKLRRLEYNVKLARPARSTATGKRARNKAASRKSAGPAALPKVAGVARATDIALPYAGSLVSVVTDPMRNGALVYLTGWTQAPLWYTIDGKGALARTALQPGSHADLGDVTATRMLVKVRDGVDVPVTVLQRKDVVHNGTAPTLLYAYGAYGISLTPDFSPTRLAWLERGGILVFAHVRGGGELGEDWHRAGMLLNKPNTWHDLIDVAAWLVQEQWTSPSRLMIRGGSEGGIAVGNALVERPDLFRAVVSEVGVHDLMRAELSANGPSDVPEIGSIANEAGFRSLLGMSSYHRVLMGVRYPAVLLTTGYNDPRVDAWQPGKMTAQLQAAAALVPGGGRPVLLRVDFSGGHGIGSTREQANDDLTDIYAFGLWQLGDPAFQPARK